jgi:hypothetical protein
VDVALDENLEKAWLIEVGNPPPVAGTGLYDWSNPEDRKVISGESGAFELRILHELDEENWQGLFRAVAGVVVKFRRLDKSVFDAWAPGVPKKSTRYQDEELSPTAYAITLLGVALAVLAVANTYWQWQNPE